jgi:hypothetical protein
MYWHQQGTGGSSNNMVSSATLAPAPHNNAGRPCHMHCGHNN